MCNEDR